MGFFSSIVCLTLTVLLHHIPKTGLEADMADNLIYNIYIVGTIMVFLESLSDRGYSSLGISFFFDGLSLQWLLDVGLNVAR